MAKATVVLGLALRARDGLVLQMETGTHFAEKDRIKRLCSSNLGDEIFHCYGRRAMAGKAIFWKGDRVKDMTGTTSWPGSSLQASSVTQAAGAGKVTGIKMADQIALGLPRTIEVFEAFAVPVEQVLFGRVVRIEGGMCGPWVVAIFEGGKWIIEIIMTAGGTLTAGA